MRILSQTFAVRRFSHDGSTRAPDELLIEEPLAIHLDGVQVSSTMRTPGNDVELATGFCLTEGVLDGAPITGVGQGSLSPDPNVIDVSTGGIAPAPTPRLGSTSSSCGVCGADAIEDLANRLEPLAGYETWDSSLLLSLPAIASEHQRVFEVTGASHAAAVFDRNGDLIVLREDIGRHNAVDKVIGHLVLEADHLIRSDLALFVSGRASFEMVQKAWAAGLSALVAVSGPSALAVETARRAGLTMFGFARSGNGTQYSPESACH